MRDHPTPARTLPPPEKGMGVAPGPRIAARWLLRCLEAVEDATVHDAALIAVNLQALASDRRRYRAEVIDLGFTIEN